MKEFYITAKESEQRCIKYCARVLPNAGNSFLYKMLRKKNITLNGKKADGTEILHTDDVIRFYFADETFNKFSGRTVSEEAKSSEKIVKTNEFIKLWNDGNIIYEDDDVLLYNKPVGMLSQKAKPDDISLNELFLEYLIRKGCLKTEELSLFKPSICNRLDRNTSGIVICGKSYTGLKELNLMIKEREIGKYYHCIAVGQVNDSILLKGYLKKEERTNKVTIKQKPFEDADYIETEIKPLHAGKKLSLLEVHLITGKTHQIRSHLASLKHPILGDYKYGDSTINKKYKQKYSISSQLLHAYRLEFPQMDGKLEQLSNKVFIAQKPKQFEQIESEV